MMNTENPVITMEDSKAAQELWRLSGEVRVLKWGAAIVITMMFAYLTYLAQQINAVRGDLTQQISQVRSDLTQQNGALQQQFGVMQQQFNVIQEGQAAIRERLTTVEQRLAAGSI